MTHANDTSQSSWQSFRREGLSWVLSLVFHCTLLAMLALVTVTQPYQAPEDLTVSISKELDPVSSSDAAEGDPASIDPQQQLKRMLSDTPMVKPQMITQVQTPTVMLPEHLTSPAVQADILMQQLSAGDTSAGSDDQQIIPMGLLDGTTEGFQRMVGQWRGSGLDVVLVIDVTGSMGPYLEQAKRRLRQIMGVITGILGDTTDPMQIVRFGVVAYKDYGDDRTFDPTACRVLPLTTNLTLVQRFLDTLHASGGGATEEPIHRAMQKATSDQLMDWKSGRLSVIILVADAPVHKAGKDQLPQIAKRFAITQRGKINTIDTGDGSRQHVLEDLQVLADNSGGQAFLLKDQQAFWEHLIVSIFGREYKPDIDLILQRYLKDQQ
jgi:Mg-chelatase subunit ChlD